MRPAQIGKICVAVLLLLPLAAPAQNRRKHGSGTKSVTSLQGRLKNLQDKKRVLVGRLKANKKKTHQTMQEIVQVDRQLNYVEVALQRTEVQLVNSRERQKVVTAELDVATDKMEVVKKEVSARLRRIYTSGPTSSLTVILGSQTGDELASRSEMMAQIARSDRQVFQEYKDLRTEVANRKRAADELVTRVTNLEQQQQAQQEQLKDARDLKDRKVKQLQQERGELEEAIQQFERDEAQLESQIAAFMRSLGKAGAKLPPLVGGFARPVSGRITSGFGPRYHPILHRSRQHAGVDFYAPTGTPIRASASGVVAASQYMRGYGNVVMIAHGSEYSTVYGHLSRRYVTPGQQIKKGQIIGASGATGLATGPHLHFEIRLRGKAINPMARM